MHFLNGPYIGGLNWPQYSQLPCGRHRPLSIRAESVHGARTAQRSICTNSLAHREFCPEVYRIDIHTYIYAYKYICIHTHTYIYIYIYKIYNLPETWILICKLARGPVLLETGHNAAAAAHTHTHIYWRARQNWPAIRSTHTSCIDKYTATWCMSKTELAWKGCCWLGWHSNREKNIYSTHRECERLVLAKRIPESLHTVPAKWGEQRVAWMSGWLGNNLRYDAVVGGCLRTLATVRATNCCCRRRRSTPPPPPPFSLLLLSAHSDNARF